MESPAELPLYLISAPHSTRPRISYQQRQAVSVSNTSLGVLVITYHKEVCYGRAVNNTLGWKVW